MFGPEIRVQPQTGGGSDESVIAFKPNVQKHAPPPSTTRIVPPPPPSFRTLSAVPAAAAVRPPATAPGPSASGPPPPPAAPPSYTPDPPATFQQPSPVQYQDFEDESFLDMANVQKLRPKPDDEEEDDPENADESGGGGAFVPRHEPPPPPPVYAHAPVHELQIPQPSPRAPFRTIDEEKQNILNQLFNLKRKGYTINKYNMLSDIHTMRSELDQINSQIDLDSGVEVAKQVLCSICTGAEWLNRKFDPFHLQLTGWSQSVMEQQHRYDRVLERLVKKYQSRRSLPPEIELIFLLVSSAVMFHLSNSLFKDVAPSVADAVKQHPGFAEAMFDAVKHQFGGSKSAGGKSAGTISEIPDDEDEEDEEGSEADSELSIPPPDPSQPRAMAGPKKRKFSAGNGPTPPVVHSRPKYVNPSDRVPTEMTSEPDFSDIHSEDMSDLFSDNMDDDEPAGVKEVKIVNPPAKRGGGRKKK
jgi:hypothetical protein